MKELLNYFNYYDLWFHEYHNVIREKNVRDFHFSTFRMKRYLPGVKNVSQSSREKIHYQDE